MLEKNPFVSLAGRLRAGLEEIHRLSSMVGTAMLAALHLVLNQFTFAVSQFLEIGFTFLATASAAYLYGPWLAGLMGIVADTLGYFLRPNGTYFPGWTLNEFLLGFLYGCWLYKSPSPSGAPCRLPVRRAADQPVPDAPLAAPCVRQRLCDHRPAPGKKPDQTAHRHVAAVHAF